MALSCGGPPKFRGSVRPHTPNTPKSGTGYTSTFLIYYENILYAELFTIFKLISLVYIAALSTQTLSIILLIFAGHIGDGSTALAAVSLCQVFVDITGYYLHFAISSALGMLASQAFGAMSSSHFHFWINIMNRLILIKQSRQVVSLTDQYMLVTISIQSIVLIAGISIWRRLFTLDERVVIGLSDIAFIIAIYHSFDSVVVEFQGMLRGIGKQDLGYITSLGFCIVAFPVSIILSVGWKMSTLGYWLGIMTGYIARVVLWLIIPICCIKWNNIEQKVRI
ncbi:Protein DETOXIFICATION 16-like isoform X2 [Oopsacas minuta]|uniref:Protein DETOXIFICATION 16-like isoform X2 n=1 Tax=Oopsacas minuta TaxID=111878 RepID=A0AAV7JW79_9METZ|nr:Protein DETOXIFICATION 16-like isoform X2 [Oopsacas minuta]